jgi:hypothetical protein
LETSAIASVAEETSGTTTTTATPSTDSIAPLTTVDKVDSPPHELATCVLRVPERAHCILRAHLRKWREAPENDNDGSGDGGCGMVVDGHARNVRSSALRRDVVIALGLTAFTIVWTRKQTRHSAVLRRLRARLALERHRVLLRTELACVVGRPFLGSLRLLS